MNSDEKVIVIPAVFLVMLKENKVLLLRRYNTGFQDGQYTLPSGHVESDEPPAVAACREAKEEVGVEVHIEDTQFEQVLYRRSYKSVGTGYNSGQPEWADFFFSTTKWKGEPSNCESNKCDDVSWFPIDELPSNMFPVVTEFLKSYPHHKAYKEAGYK